MRRFPPTIVVLAAMLLLAVAAVPAAAQKARQKAKSADAAVDRRAPEPEGYDQSFVYKTVGDVALRLYVYRPADLKPGDKRPAIVFFFGGGYNGGSPEQFAPHCRYFAERGMVAVTVDYRVKSRHNTLPADSISDGKSAIRWIRTHAEKLGVDPQRIAASGGSAGGNLACCCGVVPGCNDPQDPQDVSAVPNALVLFNPAYLGTDKAHAVTEERFPAEIRADTHIRKGLPPSIMFFGTADPFLPGAQQFHDAMVKAGNRCELMTWEGQAHGFFNFGKADNRYFIATVEAADRFLASLGFLEGEPRVKAFVAEYETAE
ncbi:alpha/beta hydrolase [Thermostilla marina]